MTAMIQNDDEKEWMLPLLELRNSLDSRDDSGHRNDRHLRDFRRLRGNVELFKDRSIPGPYTQSSREHWLRKVLETQQWLRKKGPEHVRQIELISLAELHEIRRIWVVDKHELEDSLPGIYSAVTGEEFPGRRLDDNQVFGAEEIEILKELCEGDLLHFELTRELLDVEGRYRTMARRAGLYEALERTIRRGFYDDESDATERAHRHRAIKSAVDSERNGFSDGGETLTTMLADAATAESVT